MVIKKQQGFSLIELMIATALLSMVMFSGYFAYSLYTDKWQKRTELFWQLNKNSLGLEAMSRVLEAASVYIIKNQDENYAVMFNGTQQSLTLVSHSPIFTSGSALVSFSLQTNKQGKSQLIYKELPLKNRMFINEPAQVDWQTSKVLIDDVKQLTFQYYGWESLANAFTGNLDGAELELGSIPILQRWYTQHPLQNRIMPSKISVYIKNNNDQETQIQIDLVTSSYTNLIYYLQEDV